MGKDPLFLNKIVEEKVIEPDYGRTPKPYNQFSPSMTGYCKRQMYNRKFSLTTMPRDIKGILHAGTRNHFWLEHNLPELIDDRALRTETRVRVRIETEADFDLYVYGEADAVDDEGNVYDHKYTGNTYYVTDAPKDKDKRQVNMYIYGLDGVETGQLEYVTRDGSFPEDEKMIRHTFDFDQDLFDKTVENMKAVAQAVRHAEEEGTEYENPFDKCEDECFYCGKETFKVEVKKELGRAEPDGNLKD